MDSPPSVQRPATILPTRSTVCRKDTALLEKHLRRPAVQELTGLSRSTIYNLMAKGAFPRPIKLTGKAVAWPEGAIERWLEGRAVATSEAA